MESVARLLLLVAVVVAAASGATTGALAATPHLKLKGLRVRLTHVDAHGNYSRMQLLQRAARRSHHRMSRLVARATGMWPLSRSKAVVGGGAGDLQVPVHASSGRDGGIGASPLPCP